MSDDNSFKNDEATEPTGDGAGQNAGGCGCSGPDEAAKAADNAQAASGQQVYPQVSFTTFVLSLSSSAMVHLGEVPDPDSGSVQENLPLAKHTIDILAMLKEKTCKCLDAEESRLLEGVLYELRMIYVMKTK